MRKPAVKIISLFLAALLILGLFSGVLAMFASAATQNITGKNARLSQILTIGRITSGVEVTVDLPAGVSITAGSYTTSGFALDSASFAVGSNPASVLTINQQGQDYSVTIKNVIYNGGSARNLKITVADQDIAIEATIPSTYFVSGGSSGNGSGGNDDGTTAARVITADTTVSRTLTEGKVSTGITVKFNFIDNETDYLIGDYNASEFTMPLDSSFGWSHNTRLTIKERSRGSGNNQMTYYEATLTNVSYNGSSSRNLQLTLTDYDFTMSVPIPNKYFKESGETDGTPTSDIVVQSTTVRDAAGKKLGTVGKESGPFTVEVIFYDIGLKNEGTSSIDAAKKHVFITEPTGFKLHNGSAGIIERLSSNAEYPRFRATFEKVESMGTANTLKFRVQYDFEEYEKGVKGEAAATLFQIDTESSSEDEEAAPLTPNIIVQEYSYGEEAIVAGNEFDLNVTFANTSKDVAVENVVMTIKPANGFLIAAAANTVYFPYVGAGESKPYSVKLRALPSQNTTGNNPTATDYSIEIEFKYQYPKNKKDYGESTATTKIAIPVEQLDRFSIDEITDYSQYLAVGYEGYITVPINNKGKSSILNITGSVVSESGADFVAPPAHYSGSLEASKNGTLNLSITINTPGEFTGHVVVSYEDENMNQKELRQPITIMVEQPVPPESEAPPPDTEQQQNGVTPFSVALCTLGGLMLASPPAMILMKRIKSRGNEDIDEDF